MIDASVLSRCVSTVDSVFDRDRIESIWDCRTAFEELAGSEVWLEAINEALRKIAADPGYTGDWRPNHLILNRGRGFTLSIANFDETKRYIHSSPFVGFYASLGNTPLRYETFELPGHYQNDVFDPSIKIATSGIHELAPGKVLEIRSERTVYDFKIRQPQLVLKLTTAPYQTLEWLFSRADLTAWQANDADLRSTQLRVGAYLLGRLGDSSCIPALRQLATHANHSARWAAIQALGRISRSEGMAQLEKAIQDRHPHIRRAAKKSLVTTQKPS